MKSLLTILVALFCYGCNGQPTFVMPRPTPEYKNGHRLHRLGITFDTYPPYYSCIYCWKEISPYQFLPAQYKGMFGYSAFCDSLKKKGINDENWFIEQWNNSDTSCISSEISLHKSENIWDKWKSTHKPGRYFINKYDWMSTDNFVGSNDTTDGSLRYAMGGRFSDSIILSDKWYKIILDTPKTKQK